MLAEGAYVPGEGSRKLIGLREPDAVLRRHEYRRGQARERQVGGGEAIAAEVAPPVGEACRHRVEAGLHPRTVVADGRVARGRAVG